MTGLDAHPSQQPRESPYQVKLAEQGRPWAVRLVFDRLLPAENLLNVGATAIPEDDPDEVLERILAKLRFVAEPGVPTIPAELAAEIPEQSPSSFVAGITAGSLLGVRALPIGSSRFAASCFARVRRREPT